MVLRLTALVLACAALLGAADQRDLIILKAGAQKKLAFIDSELGDKLIIRTSAQARQSEQRLSEVASWEYAEMRDGYWPQANEARDAGRFAIAADMFNQLATTGTREWQKVYGAYHEGTCWELLGDHVKAAEAFGRAALVNPAHRLALDARYRQGFAQARAKQDAEAQKIATELDDLAKKERNTAADLRSHAIRAVLAFNAGNGDLLKKEGRLALFNPRDDKTATVQFGTFFAEALRLAKLPRDSENEYKRLLGLPELEPAERISLQLGYAKVLADTDKSSALVELLRIDALPFGSIEQKCEVRYLAGKLLAEEVKAGKATPPTDEATRDWLKAQERTARLLLNAAANSTATITARDAAKTELEALGPDPDAPKEEPKKDEAKPADSKPEPKKK